MKVETLVYAIFDILTEQILTSTDMVLVAKPTDTVVIPIASSCIITLWTCATATIYICFILIFDFIITCFRGLIRELVRFEIQNIRSLRTHILFLQMFPPQSESLLQVTVSLHFGHELPPQSMPVSS